VRGRSHGDWNRFHFSQILGAERVTMLLESRHPLLFVLQSTWTTPEEMLPGGVAVEVTASPETVGGRAAHVGLRPPLPHTFTDGQAELARRFWHDGPGSFWVATGTVGGEAHSTFAAQKGRVPTSTVSVEPTAHSEPWGCYYGNGVVYRVDMRYLGPRTLARMGGRKARASSLCGRQPPSTTPVESNTRINAGGQGAEAGRLLLW